MPKRFLVRVMSPILGLSFLLIASGGFGAWYIHRAYRDVAERVQQYLPTTQAAIRLEYALHEAVNELHLARSGRTDNIRSALDWVQEIIRQMEVARKHETTSRGEILILELERDIFVLFRPLRSETSRTPPLRLTPSEFQDFAEQLLDSGLTPEAMSKAKNYREFREAQLAESISEVGTQARRAGLLLGLLGLLGATAGVIGGFGVARVLQQSLVELSLPVRDAAGRLSEVVGPIRITSSSNLDELQTSLGELSQRVATAVNRLQEAQREHLRAEQLAALGQLAAGLAHELRNPLTAMKTLVQAARYQGGESALDARDLEILEEEMTRLSKTLQTFLDYARPPTPERRWTELEGVIQGTLDLVSPRASQQGVTLTTELPPTLPPVYVDAEQIRQTLLNLLLNSLDAMPRGGRIVISAVHEQRPESTTTSTPETGTTATALSDSDSDAEWLRVTLRDSGSGLPQDLGDKVFEPFISTKEAGTGLGLAICRQIMESHGGSIQAVNGSRAGAEFVLRLPVHRAGPPSPEAS